MKIYITGLPSGYEVEHLVRLFYPMAPLTLTPPEEGEDCVWAEKKEDSLYAMVREQGQSRDCYLYCPIILSSSALYSSTKSSGAMTFTQLPCESRYIIIPVP